MEQKIDGHKHAQEWHRKVKNLIQGLEAFLEIRLLQVSLKIASAYGMIGTKSLSGKTTSLLQLLSSPYNFLQKSITSVQLDSWFQERPAATLPFYFIKLRPSIICSHFPENIWLVYAGGSFSSPFGMTVTFISSTFIYSAWQMLKDTLFLGQSVIWTTLQTQENFSSNCIVL